MWFRHRAWIPIAWVLSLFNVGGVWFAAREGEPWHVTDAPADYIDTMLGAIIGLEIPLTRLVGKWKMSQNRPAEDRAGVVNGLSQEGDPSQAVIADLIRKSNQGTS